MYKLYILRCADNSFYTGITNNLERRLKKHREGKGSKYVRSRLPIELVYNEDCINKSVALKREIEIKSLNHREKEKLIFL